jgi:hypothetical protein
MHFYPMPKLTVKLSIYQNLSNQREVQFTRKNHCNRKIAFLSVLMQLNPFMTKKKFSALNPKILVTSVITYSLTIIIIVLFEELIPNANQNSLIRTK